MISEENMNNTNRIILVTGGAGFIGSNLIRYFLEKYPDYKIVNFDKLTYAGNLHNLNNVEDDANYVFVKGDVTNSRVVKNVFEEFNPDYVVHCAAESHVDRSLTNPEVFLQTNITGTQIILDQALEHQVEKFVQISTDEVYGAKLNGLEADEETRMNPTNPYSASKAAADFLVLIAHQNYNQNVNIIRSCNNYGPYQFPEKLIPLMILKAMKDADLPVYGDGKQIREWIHVKDHCQAIDLVLHQGKSGEIYNVGTGVERVNIELIERTLQKFPDSKSQIKFVQDRIGHDFRYAMNSNKIHQELGWQPEVLFDNGLDQTIEWYKIQQDWIDSIRTGEYIKYNENAHKSRMME